MTTTEKINEHYNVNDRELHVTGEYGDVEIWLNTSVADFDGVAIGCGESRAQAITDAIETLERALGVLRERVLKTGS